MNNAHNLDNRRGICSLGFQAFVRTGVPDWSSHVHDYLKQKDSYARNRITELDLHNKLIYNGMDSLTTFLLAEKQMKDLKMSHKLK